MDTNSPVAAKKLVLTPTNRGIGLAKQSGLLLDFGSCGRTVFIGLLFFCGYEIAHEKFEVPVDDVFMASMLIFLALIGVGIQAANVPSMAKARESAVPVFSIIDEVSTLDTRKSSPDQIKEISKG